MTTVPLADAAAPVAKVATPRPVPVCLACLRGRPRRRRRPALWTVGHALDAALRENA